MRSSHFNVGAPYIDIGSRTSIKIALLMLMLSFNLVLAGIVSVNETGWKMGHTGLASILPTPYFAGLLLFLVFYLYLVFHARSRGFLLLATGMLVIVLFGTPLLIEGTPRFTYSFITGGVTDYVLRTGHTNTDWYVTGLLSMFQNWPAAFFLGGMAMLAGNVSMLDVLRYTPVVSQILYIFPLYMIFSALFPDTKKVFAGCLFFFVANWVNQEYFSSQNLGLLLALFIIAIILKALVIKDLRVRFLALFLIVFSSLVITHALTSIFIYFSLALFLGYMLMGKLRKEKRLDAAMVILLALVTAILGAWSFFFASSQMSSVAVNSILNIGFFNIFHHFQDSLSLGASTASDRGAQGIVIGLKVAGAAAFAAIGLTSLLVYGYRVRKGIEGLSTAALLFIFILVADLIILLFPFYSYESIIRVYLFSIICFTFFAVRMIDNKKIAAILVLFLLALAPVSIFIHYGKENVDYMTPDTINGVDFLFDKARTGAVLAGVSLDAYRDYEQYAHQTMDFNPVGDTYDFEKSRGSANGAYYIMNDGTRNIASNALTRMYESKLGNSYDKIYVAGDFVLYHQSP